MVVSEIFFALLALPFPMGADVRISAVEVTPSNVSVEVECSKPARIDLQSAASPTGTWKSVGTAEIPEPPTNRPDGECDGRNYVFVHGFNVNPEEARASAAEVFKRLWQSGLQSMFTAVTWYGNQEQFETPTRGTVSMNYYANALHAFETAPSPPPPKRVRQSRRCSR